MNINNLDSPPPSATFGQDASFRLEQPIGAMSISPSGRDVVLASKEGLHIIDLDSPFSPPRHLPHRTPWEVADVQWSPFAIRDYWIVSTSNQKALVWNVGISGWRDAIEFVLHGHSRAITDINFSAHHPDTLATCAVDSFVHGWDLRTPSRPVFSFSDWFAGATQVKWSRQDEHVIASSHDRFLHIWDRRKGAYPARTIEAHNTKIYGIDWNRFEPTKIVTCSLDKTIKFWNIDDPQDVPERVIDTPFPVWRARHTPFGWGLCAMPQRGNSDLHLYDRRPVDGVLQSGAIPAVATFTGHKGQVKEFLWRSRGTIKDGVDHRDFQLVSWGNDGELRLHSVEKDTLSAVGYEKGVTRPMRLLFTRRNARYRTFRDETVEPYSPLEIGGRNDSNQSHHYSFGARARRSTNIGMSKLPVAQFRGWLNSGRRERRTGMHGKSTFRQDMNPIAWMKNVKITSWDPDSLADEITQVGERFKKLEFEAIDMAQRKAAMSFQGPWGENGSMVYTKVDFRFPKAYPRDAAAAITVYKTGSIDDEVHKTLTTEVNTISETFASRQRGCIEATIRYLLHEQTMEQVVSYLLGETTNSKAHSSNGLTDDMSSDSDDDNLDRNNADPSSLSANIRVPLAKGCGALWSTTGELVCFFPQKSKEPTSILTRFGASGLGDSQSSRLFEGFGRLQTSSPARRDRNGTQPTHDDTSSETSDVGSMFSKSSSSSSSSDSEVGIRAGFAQLGSAIDVGLRPQSRSPDRSNKSTTLDGTKAGEEIVRQNVISIHYDVKELLPSQKHLAEQYRISGSSSETCIHNQRVAEEALLPELASIWQLASLLLEEKVPLEVLELVGRSQEDITVIARRSVLQLLRKDSGVDLSYDHQVESDVVGKIRWGSNPLGARYLLKAIFSYFERRADIQTLAMLSCVFAQSKSRRAQASRYSNDSTAPIRSAYHPSIEVVDSYLHLQNATLNKFTLAVTKPMAAAKMEENLILSALREPQHRRRNTASVAFRPDMTREENGARDMSVALDSSGGGTSLARTIAMSVSTSPEDSRLNRRTQTGIPFAASRASLNALAQSFQHSPPSNSSTAGSSLKKFSPSATSGWAGNIFSSAQNSRASRASQVPSEANSDDGINSNLRASMSLANLQDYRKDSRKFRDSRGSIKSAVGVINGKVDIPGKTKKRTIKTTLRNQSRFDLDGYSDLSLLDPNLQWKYQAYIQAYADQLGSWGLFLQRAEVLQFEGHFTDVMHEVHRGSGKIRNHHPKLEITRCCIECGSSFVPVERNGIPIGWHCATISCQLANDKASKSLVCSICQQVVRGLSVPCLQCGHLTCYDCAHAWFNLASDGHGPEPSSSATHLNFCPTGCGCHCPTLETITVPFPPINPATPEPPEPLQSTSRNQRAEIYNHLTPPAPILRQNSAQSARSHRHKSETPTVSSTATTAVPPMPGPDTALGAMMALSLSRSRAPSTTTASTSKHTSVSAIAPNADSTDTHHYHHNHSHSHSRSNSHSNSHSHSHSHSELTANSVGNTATGSNTVNNNSAGSIDDLLPWSSGKFTSLGRGIGGGLSRGLSNRGSDATIRKA